MPIKRCSKGDKRGWKWGDSGKCYLGPKGKEKASKQAQAAYSSGYKKK